MALINRFDALAEATRLVPKYAKRSDLEWVYPGCVAEITEKEFAGRRLSKINRSMVQRHLAQALSAQLTKQIAKEESIELKGARCASKDSFIVHNFMNPWHLFQNHARHLRHPEKEWEFWNARPHRTWVEKIITLDALVPDLHAQFQSSFEGWLAVGSVREIKPLSGKLEGAVYAVNAAT